MLQRSTSFTLHQSFFQRHFASFTDIYRHLPRLRGLALTVTETGATPVRSALSFRAGCLRPTPAASVPPPPPVPFIFTFSFMLPTKHKPGTRVQCQWLQW